MPERGRPPVSLEAGFRVGKCEVYPREGRLLGPKGELRLEPKAMAVLVELARCAPEACTREEIIRRVWPRGFVSDDVLTRCIGQLRKALEDDPQSPRHVETLPKRGYRLRSAVAPLVEQVNPAPSPGAGRMSLIVLPFQNLSPAAEDFVADGITELLIARLAAVPGLRVISRTTAMQFKGHTGPVAEISARTGTDWLIEGSVLQSGDRIQVVAQLIDARSDTHVWAADYLRDLQDLLLLQNEIVARVASAIHLQLGATPISPAVAPALPPQAMRDYLKARHLLSRRTVPCLGEARLLLAAVTEAVPDYASGWASLAECEMLLAHYGAPGLDELLAMAEAHVERALTLQPDLAIGLSTRGAMRFFFRRDLSGAARDLERALVLLPSYAMSMLSLANVCAVRSDFAEARAWMSQALLVDPLDVGMRMNVGDHLILERCFAQAADALRTATEIAPDHRPSRLRLSWALALDGQHDRAAEALGTPCGAATEDAQWQEYAAMLAGLRRDIDAAARCYERLRPLGREGHASAWTLARAAAAAGRQEDAVDWLEQAGRRRSSSIPFMLVTPAFDSLHGNARFRLLGETLGLPAAD